MHSQGRFCLQLMFLPFWMLELLSRITCLFCWHFAEPPGVSSSEGTSSVLLSSLPFHPGFWDQHFHSSPHILQYSDSVSKQWSSRLRESTPDEQRPVSRQLPGKLCGSRAGKASSYSCFWASFSKEDKIPGCQAEVSTLWLYLARKQVVYQKITCLWQLFLLKVKNPIKKKKENPTENHIGFYL